MENKERPFGPSGPRVRPMPEEYRAPKGSRLTSASMRILRNLQTMEERREDEGVRVGIGILIMALRGGSDYSLYSDIINTLTKDGFIDNEENWLRLSPKGREILEQADKERGKK